MSRRNEKRESIHLLPTPGFTCFLCPDDTEGKGRRVDLEPPADPVAAYREHYNSEHFTPIITVGDAS